jgi:Yip1 domain
MSTDPMAIPASTPDPAPAAQISPFGRIIGMFFSPKPTFEDIVREPSWILPTLLILVMTTCSVVALNMHFDWKGYVAQQIEKSPRAASLSADQKQQQIDAGAKYAPMFSYIFGLPVPLLGLVIVSLLLWGIYSLFGGAGIDFKTSFAIVSHAFIPAAVVGTLLFLLVLFLKPVGAFDLENPVATNLAVFFPEDSAKWLMALGKNLDLLEFWKLILLGIGFGAANPRKLKGAKPFLIAFGAFLVYIIVRVGIAFIFS